MIPHRSTSVSPAPSSRYWLLVVEFAVPGSSAELCSDRVIFLVLPWISGHLQVVKSFGS